MEKIQKITSKFGLLFFFYLVFSLQSAEAQTDKQKLWIADSLFSSQEYTEAFDIYSELYYDNGLSSPSMLLRMAFIKEGLEDYTMALYYLNDYYIITSDERALEKMDRIAEEYNLAGYNYTDKEYFLSQYHEFYDELIFLFSGLTLIFFGGIFWYKYKKGQKPVGSFFGMAFSGAILILLLDFGMGYREGIINEPNTYIMKGPSAGAGVLAVVDPGHKIEIQGKKDVWYQVQWNDEVAYVREGKVIPITTW